MRVGPGSRPASASGCRSPGPSSGTPAAPPRRAHGQPRRPDGGRGAGGRTPPPQWPDRGDRGPPSGARRARQTAWSSCPRRWRWSRERRPRRHRPYSEDCPERPGSPGRGVTPRRRSHRCLDRPHGDVGLADLAGRAAPVRGLPDTGHRGRAVLRALSGVLPLWRAAAGPRCCAPRAGRLPRARVRTARSGGPRRPPGLPPGRPRGALRRRRGLAAGRGAAGPAAVPGGCARRRGDCGGPVVVPPAGRSRPARGPRPLRHGRALADRAACPPRGVPPGHRAGRAHGERGGSRGGRAGAPRDGGNRGAAEPHRGLGPPACARRPGRGPGPRASGSA